MGSRILKHIEHSDQSVQQVVQNNPVLSFQRDNTYTYKWDTFYL